MAEREDRTQRKLFRTETVPGKAGSGRLFDEHPVTPEPVECLGMTFESEDARRTYFLDRLRENLPELRKRPDFPVGEDDDILRLSDPPWYTACPNPFLAEFVGHHGRPYDPDEPYHREPLAVDVSEGKTDPLYRAHGYHTKVPHRAIVPSILHYTRPGDLILDGFCGTGMTGVAAQCCETPPEVVPLRDRDTVAEARLAGARVGAAPHYPGRSVARRHLHRRPTTRRPSTSMPSRTPPGVCSTTWRRRSAGCMTRATPTARPDGSTTPCGARCSPAPECAGEVVFLREALDQETMRVRTAFPCPSCRAALSRKRLERLYGSRYDAALGGTIRTPKRIPVLINYSVGKMRYTKPCDDDDFETLRTIEAQNPSPWIPLDKLPYMHMTHERARMDRGGITHLHHFFLPRAAHALAALWRGGQACNEPRLRNMLLFFVEQAIWGMSVLNRYQPIQHGRPGGSQVNRQLSGVYYVGSQIAEVSPWYILDGKLRRLSKAFKQTHRPRTVAVSTGDCSGLDLPDSAVDYVFTDPPFGENIYYADLNYLVESWHRVRTASGPEAIIDRAKGKDLTDYLHAMQRWLRGVPPRSQAGPLDDGGVP